MQPENVLFTSDHVLKLADFGLAIDLHMERAVTRAGGWRPSALDDTHMRARARVCVRGGGWL